MNHAYLDTILRKLNKLENSYKILIGTQVFIYFLWQNEILLKRLHGEKSISKDDEGSFMLRNFTFSDDDFLKSKRYHTAITSILSHCDIIHLFDNLQSQLNLFTMFGGFDYLILPIFFVTGISANLFKFYSLPIRQFLSNKIGKNIIDGLYVSISTLDVYSSFNYKPSFIALALSHAIRENVGIVLGVGNSKDDTEQVITSRGHGASGAISGIIGFFMGIIPCIQGVYNISHSFHAKVILSILSSCTGMLRMNSRIGHATHLGGYITGFGFGSLVFYVSTILKKKIFAVN